jgi:hypothetical protein
VIGDRLRSVMLRGAGVIGVAALLVTGCSSSGHPGPGQAGRTASPARASASASPVGSPTPARSRKSGRPLPVAPGQGKLAQTRVRPPDHGRAFHAMVTDLWLAVRRDKPSLATAAFFPEAAYKQVKAIYDPAADWRSRLWDDFALDVRAAHRMLGRHPDRARLIKVIVQESGAAWIDPGVCYNRIGYWHVANPRVVYRLHGQERSFGIASLISWRGVWYVVHFGGVVRPAIGMVDAPATGPGYAGPQGGC